MNSSSVFIEEFSSLSVTIHPVVLLSILDHHSRRNKDQHRVIGTLLGSSYD
jgi:hypothetical protein